MSRDDSVNILLVDDQPAKLLSYEVMLSGLGENLIKAASAREALEQLLRNEIAVILVDVCMPELDGFQLAAMIREHPRFQNTAMIFISAIHLSDVDRLRGYEMGAVDYVPVPVIPEVLRAKVKVFAELYRKTRQLEQLNTELEHRVVQRTIELEASTARLLESESRRNLALAAGNMGSWDWDSTTGDCLWDAGQYRIFGVDPESFVVTLDSIRALLHPEDWERLRSVVMNLSPAQDSYQTDFRVVRPDGEVRWCIGSAAGSFDENGRLLRMSGVTIDITERKQAEEHHALLAREVDHRAKNTLAVVQSIVRLTRANSVKAYVAAVEGRIRALSRAHTLLAQSRWQGAELRRLVEEELAPYRAGDADKIETGGPDASLEPAAAQTIAIALHELATNAAKHGALSTMFGRVRVRWELVDGRLLLHWTEMGGPPVQHPTERGFGTKVITASIESQLDGEALFDWREEGLRCTLSIPMGERAKSDTAPAPGSRDEAEQASARTCVLLVEDEALVGMMLRDVLTGLGVSVIGPVGKAADAVAVAQDCDIEAAILDVNLGGELVYPVADVLAARGVPFVFATGYGAESIDQQFRHVPVLEKPIEREKLERLFVDGERGIALSPRWFRPDGQGEYDIALSGKEARTA